MTRNSPIDRRSVLQATGGAFAGIGATGLATATISAADADDFAAADPDDLVAVNVGFERERGRMAALDAAEEVIREFSSLAVVTIRTRGRAAEDLASRSDVRYVEENGRMHALAQTYSDGVNCIDADEAHACGVTGGGVDVAIVDTGIDSDHPDLQANLGAGKAFVTCDSGYATCNYAWDDDNDHGTGVAGVVGAVDNAEGIVGVAPESTLHAVKVLDHNGAGTYSDIAAGIEWAADQGHEVINLSLGGDSSQTLHDAVRYADSKGSILVAAAGNDGPCTDCVSYPAAYPEVVAVAATNDCGSVSDFSSTGSELDFLAPGGNVYTTTRGGYDYYTGTSMATPHVSGSVALVLDAGYADPVQRLCETADDSWKCSCCGIVDPAEAVGCDSDDIVA